MLICKPRYGWLWLIVLLPCPALAEEPLEFNRDIRPILAENCFYCHGQDANKRQADLRLDTREAAIEAQAIVPGRAADSELMARIMSSDPDTQMPPPKSNRSLTPTQKDLLRRWLDAGAQYQPHWAFVAPKRPEPPDPASSPWSRQPIDTFVWAKLSEAGLMPAAPANRKTLIKRLASDFKGLPPSPDEVEAFVNDKRPDAYERLVDRYLSSPRYGERLALPWLDAARYADSNGFQQDGDTWQWLWRDWVVRAMNADLPFDQFTIWQLAGDLLPEASIDQKIASGFNRNHLLNGEGGAIAEEQRFVILFDRMDTTSTTWLGLTMACAQCHDHKYDPLTMKDYYSLMDAFNRVPETGTPQRFSARIRVAPPILELPTPDNTARLADFDKRIQALETAANDQATAAYAGWLAAVESAKQPDVLSGLPQRAVELLSKAVGERTAMESTELGNVLRKHFDEKVKSSIVAKLPDVARQEAVRKELAEYKADQIPRVMIMSDDKPRETAILERGEYLKPKQRVTFATPEFLPPLPAGAPLNRLGFAQWLIAPEHPLTARVQVNRMWQYFFGIGLVKTAEDFGVQSEFPLHGALLDWLAVEFRESGWSSKWLQRQIALSQTYLQSSRLSPEQRGRDPENKYFARGSRFRMPALLLRDWALASSGLLETRFGGQPVYPYQPDDVWEALAITKERDFSYPQSSGSDLYRRSLYTFWRRTVGPANMFDASNRQTCRVRASITSTPLHALTTLNDPTWIEAARVLAEHALQTHATLADQLRSAVRQVLCRDPEPAEMILLQRAYEKQLEIYQREPLSAQQLLSVGKFKRDEHLPATQHAALTQVTLGLLNLDEALTRE